MKHIDRWVVGNHVLVLKESGQLVIAALDRPSDGWLGRVPQPYTLSTGSPGTMGLVEALQEAAAKQRELKDGGR
jgi:hypothetical protein